MGNCYVTLEGDREVLVKQNGGHWIPDWAEYKYLDFADGAAALTVTAKGKGKITVRTDGQDPLCVLEVDSAEPAEHTASIPPVAGRHSLWLFLEGEMTLYGFAAQK
jgi:hypothetical protein